MHSHFLSQGLLFREKIRCISIVTLLRFPSTRYYRAVVNSATPTRKFLFDALFCLSRFPARLYLFRRYFSRQVRPSPESRVALVTQCSADRLATVLKQALRWGGDISLAVLVPSAPSSTAAKVCSTQIVQISDISRSRSSRSYIYRSESIVHIG